MAAEKLNLVCHSVSEDGNLLCLEGSTRPWYFLRNQHPFNDYVSGQLANDKGYQYELFAAAGLLIPKFSKIFNPLAPEQFNRYKKHQSVSEIIQMVEKEFTYPLIVKKCQGSGGRGVFLENGKDGLAQRLENLFTSAGFFDNVILIQAYIPGDEYRIVASQNKVLLVYKKTSQSKSLANLNPLHQVDGRAVKVSDERIIESFNHLISKLAKVIDLGFYAVDLIIRDGQLYILEINANPICFFYNRDNHRHDFTAAYEYLLKKYIS